MAEFLTVDDLLLFAPDLDEDRAQGMIDDATALALLAAPCIADDDFDGGAAVLAILRSVVLRWNDAGSGAVVSETIGGFSQTLDTRSERRGLFWPSEISHLQSLCSSSGTSYTVSMAGADATVSANPYSDFWNDSYIPGAWRL